MTLSECANRPQSPRNILETKMTSDGHDPTSKAKPQATKPVLVMKPASTQTFLYFATLNETHG